MAYRYKKPSINFAVGRGQWFGAKLFRVRNRFNLSRSDVASAICAPVLLLQVASAVRRSSEIRRSTLPVFVGRSGRLISHWSLQEELGKIERGTAKPWPALVDALTLLFRGRTGNYDIENCRRLH